MINSSISVKTEKSPVLRKYGITKLLEYESVLKLMPGVRSPTEIRKKDVFQNRVFING